MGDTGKQVSKIYAVIGSQYAIGVNITIPVNHHFVKDFK